MVDIRGGSEPQQVTFPPLRVHDTEVVLAGPNEKLVRCGVQVSEASYQQGDALSPPPVNQVSLLDSGILQILTCKFFSWFQIVTTKGLWAFAVQMWFLYLSSAWFKKLSCDLLLVLSYNNYEYNLYRQSVLLFCEFQLTLRFKVTLQYSKYIKLRIRE